MGNKIELTHRVLISIVIIQIVLSQAGFVFVEGRITPLKTIESEDGDVIDCVDIYKQPAFDHPLLKNHTIQMRPSSYPNGMEANNFVTSVGLQQTWHKSGRCPEGTIPIRRIRNKSLQNLGKKLYNRIHYSKKLVIPDTRDGEEYAVATLASGTYYGAEAFINVWNPKVEQPSEVSTSQIWVTSGEDETTVNTIEAGWIVDQELNGDNQTRTFIKYSSDHPQNKGCYNLHCPGFVQTNTSIPINSVIKPLSTYNGQQLDIIIAIFKDKQSGNWWLRLQGSLLGYWPASIFTGLSNSATTLYWGGKITNKRLQGGRHTTTEMGSGHLPSEGGFGTASYIRNCRVVDESNNFLDAVGLMSQTTNSACYDVHINDGRDALNGYHFFYGGPGLSQTCT